MIKKLLAVELVKEKIVNKEFANAHKYKADDFTRNRKLTFSMVFMHLFRKTVKSLQVSLNELYMNHYIFTPVSASAYTQARNKFKHTAFVELNNDMIDIFYSIDEDVKKWNGYRRIGADGSKIILPKWPEIAEEFGSITVINKTMESSFSCAMFECYYDVLNHIAIKSMVTVQTPA